MKLEQNSKRDFLVTVFLARYGFAFGLHRFYCGKILTGVLYLVGWFFSGRELNNVIFTGYIKVFFDYIYKGRIDVLNNFLDHFKSNNGFFYSYLTLIVVIFSIIDSVLIVCGKFRDNEGKIVCYSKIFDRNKNKCDF